MEPETCFDLERAVIRWRGECESHETFSSGALAELESHLRDSVEALREKGLSVEEAFWVARGRLGDVAALARESQASPAGAVWTRRVAWMLGGVMTYEIIGTTANLFGAMLRFLLVFLREPNSHPIGSMQSQMNEAVLRESFAFQVTLILVSVGLLWLIARKRGSLLRWTAQKLTDRRWQALLIAVSMLPLVSSLVMSWNLWPQSESAWLRWGMAFHFLRSLLPLGLTLAFLGIWKRVRKGAMETA